MSVNEKLLKNNETISGINKKLKSTNGFIKPLEEIYTKPSGSVAISQNGVYNVSGKATVNVNVPSSDTETEEKTVDLDLSTGNQEINPSANKLLSKVTINKPSTLIPENILKDIVIAGVTGTAEEIGGVSKSGTVGVLNVGVSEDTKNAVHTFSIPSVYVHDKNASDGDTYLTKIYTPAESFQSFPRYDNLSVNTTVSVNRTDGYSAVMELGLNNPNKTLQITATNLTAENIKSGVSILGVTGTYSGSESRTGDVSYDESNNQVTINGVVYDLVEHTGVLNLSDDTELPLPPAVEGYSKIIIIKDSSYYYAYYSQYGWGVVNNYLAPFADDSGETLDTSASKPYKKLPLSFSSTDEWTSTAQSTDLVKVSYFTNVGANQIVYRWSSTNEQTSTVYQSKNF